MKEATGFLDSRGDMISEGDYLLSKKSLKLGVVVAVKPESDQPEYVAVFNEPGWDKSVWKLSECTHLKIASSKYAEPDGLKR